MIKRQNKHKLVVPCISIVYNRLIDFMKQTKDTGWGQEKTNEAKFQTVSFGGLEKLRGQFFVVVW